MFRHRPVQLAQPGLAGREVSPLAMYQAGRLNGIAQPYALQGEVSPLELFGAQLAPDLSGWWVYCFADPGGGAVWYAGQSEKLWSRWRDHYYHFGERWVRADKYLIGVPNQAEADVAELMLIIYYQPEFNTKGRRAELERRVRAWNRGGHELQKRVLDPGQTVN